MKATSTGPFSCVLEITPEDCIEHGIDFEKFKEYYIYQQNKPLYDKVPAYYFEPPTPPKKPSLLNRIFKKKTQPEPPEKISESQNEFDIYFQKKFDEIKAKGLTLYSKADLVPLYESKNKLIDFVRDYVSTEAKNDMPSFEDGGNFSYHYEINEDNHILFYLKTASYIL